MKDLYTENYKMMMKYFGEETNKWKESPCSWIERINIVIMSIPPKATYKFNMNPIKIVLIFSKEIGNAILRNGTTKHCKEPKK